MDYESLKMLAKEKGCRVTELLVLAPQNDPFYVGQPAQVLGAEWFRDLWERFGYTNGVRGGDIK